jgi:hypothetical protein
MEPTRPTGSQNRPASPAQAPDPARSYERARPEAEPGMGRLDSGDAVAHPADEPDRLEQAAKNRQEPRQINAHSTVNRRLDGNAPQVSGEEPERGTAGKPAR